MDEKSKESGQVRFCDEWEVGFGWIHPEPAWIERAGHALLAAGRVWVIDPADGEGVEERIRSLGEPAGVVQLLDRHARDCARFAERLGVPLHVLPAGLPGSPFQVVRVARARWWREVALWWPEERGLVVADALGTAPHYLARGERLAVNPALRLLPPRRLLALEPRWLACGHGEGVAGEEAAALVREALTTARRRVPAWMATQLRRTAR